MPANPAAIRAEAELVRDAPDMRDNDGQLLEPDQPPILDNCPVQPLGRLKLRYFFLDDERQLIELGTDFKKGEIMGLFGKFMSYLERKWPQHRNVGTQAKPEFIIDGFSQKDVQRDLIVACAHRGLFDPQGRVRGRGAHAGTNDELVLHCGDKVLIAGARSAHGHAIKPTYYPPGLLGEYVYPAGSTLRHPHAQAADTTEVQGLMDTLETWTWGRGRIDALLMLGWYAAANIGGALKWRPHIWVHGPSGCGKSTLEDLFRALMGDWAIRTEDATEAALRQTLNMDTLAVMYDEAEPDEDGSRAMSKIVKLVRLASSGSSSMRGGTDHKAQEFIIRSCFMFTSILHQELPQQDRNRITTMQLAPLRKGLAKMAMNETKLAELGQKMRRRIVEQWPRFKRTLLAYQAEMQAQGYEARHQDQYGTLLAGADLLLYETAPDPMDISEPEYRVTSLVAQLAGVLDTVRREAETDTERCVKYLASKRLPSAGGAQQETVSQWLEKALLRSDMVGDGGQSYGQFNAKAQDKLKSHGLKLVEMTDKGGGRFGLVEFTGRTVSIYLAIANKSNAGMAELFQATLWGGGVWTQSLALVPGAQKGDGCKTRFAGPAENCLILPVHHLVDMDRIIERNRERAPHGYGL
jgi:hypothetical protein